MESPTIVRTALVKDDTEVHENIHLCVVSTSYNNGNFSAYVQSYVVYGEGQTSLRYEREYADERTAIKFWQTLIAE